MADMAQAAVLTDPRRFDYREYPLPDIGPADGLLRVEAGGLCGTDYEQYCGHLKGTPWDVWPIIPGHEIMGWIDKVGAEAARVWGVREGDRVVIEANIPCGQCFQCQVGRVSLCEVNDVFGLRIPVDQAPHLWGGYATHMYLPPRSIVHKAPERTPTDVLSLFNPMSNAVRWALERGQVTVGQSIVISGPGQRGLLSVVCARAVGASLIVVTGTSADSERLKVAENLGAHATINVEEEDPVERVRDLTGGRGVDVVLDVSAGAVEPIAQAVEMVRVGGTVVLAGLKHGRAAEGLLPDRIVIKELNVVGALSSGWTAYDTALGLIQDNEADLKQLCTHAYPVGEAEKAVQVLGREFVDGHEAIHIHIENAAP